MPQWQVEDYHDIHDEIDSSLNLDTELTNNHYTRLVCGQSQTYWHNDSIFIGSDAMLSINNMTVFKQESPSPTMNDQLQKRNRQSPTSTQQGSIAFSHATGNVEENSQNMFSNTINQLLSQTGLTTLHNVIDGELWDAKTEFIKCPVPTTKIKIYLN